MVAKKVHVVFQNVPHVYEGTAEGSRAAWEKAQELAKANHPKYGVGPVFFDVAVIACTDNLDTLDRMDGESLYDFGKRVHDYELRVRMAQALSSVHPDIYVDAHKTAGFSIRCDKFGTVAEVISAYRLAQAIIFLAGCIYTGASREYVLEQLKKL